MALTTVSDDNYASKLRQLRSVGQLPSGPGVRVLTIAHDPACGFWRETRCDCDPTLREDTLSLVHTRCAACGQASVCQPHDGMFECPRCGWERQEWYCLWNTRCMSWLPCQRLR